MYLINDIDQAKEKSNLGLFLSWSNIDDIKWFSELGIIFDNDLIGFRILRRARYERLFTLADKVNQSVSADKYNDLQQWYKRYPKVL